MNIRNGAAFLPQALDSVIAQTFHDWELIAWDDCSTDKSSEIVSRYKDPRIRYFLSPEPIPLGRARAGAIAQAQGEWLAFLDQDDLWAATKLARQIALAEPGVAIIYGRAVLFWPDGRKRDYDQAHEFVPLPEGDIFSELFCNACFIAMSSAMLHRRAVENTSIQDSIEITPDYYLYVALARRYRARAVQEVVCWYRMHSGNMWQESRRKIHQEALSLIGQWSGQLDPRVANYRRMTHATSLAWDELRNFISAPSGIRRLLAEGSVTWMMSRPFVEMYRRVRRLVRQPMWKKSASSSFPNYDSVL
jgi:glycosyltransferase involved in cell wall biosynthesis